MNSTLLAIRAIQIETLESAAHDLEQKHWEYNAAAKLRERAEAIRAKGGDE
jgi:hypothetical protein